MVGIGGGGGGGGVAAHYHQVYVDDNDNLESDTPAGTGAAKKATTTVTAAADTDGDKTRTHKWRPWPLQPWYFVLIILIHVASIVTLQLITAFCTPYGCHLFGERSNTEVSVLDRAIYQAMPPSFSVCFGFLWMVVRHDVYRMEPFFLMSKQDGASAVDSLLMQYTHLLPHSILMGSIRKKYVHIPTWISP